MYRPMATLASLWNEQGAHHWYEELKIILINLGFKVSQADEAVFY